MELALETEFDEHNYFPSCAVLRRCRYWGYLSYLGLLGYLSLFGYLGLPLVSSKSLGVSSLLKNYGVQILP